MQQLTNTFNLPNSTDVEITSSDVEITSSDTAVTISGGSEEDSNQINLGNFCLRRNAGTSLDQITSDESVDLNLEIDYEIEREADCSEKNYSLNLRTFDTTKRVFAPCRDHNRYCST